MSRPTDGQCKKGAEAVALRYMREAMASLALAEAALLDANSPEAATLGDLVDSAAALYKRLNS